MAKRKKSRAHQESKGERRNVAKSTRKQMRDAVTPLTIMSNKMKAWRAGKNVIVTIPNPNKKETINGLQTSWFLAVHGYHER